MTIEEQDITPGWHTFSHVGAAMKPAASQAADQIDEIIRPLRKGHIHNEFSCRGIRIRQLADELTAHSKVRRVSHDVPPVSRASEHESIAGHSPAGRKV